MGYGVQKMMIKKILRKQVPLFFIYIILFLSLSTIGFCYYFQSQFLTQQKEQEHKNYLQIIGELEAGEEIDHIIIDLLQGKTKEDKIQVGENKLLPYGYDNDFFYSSHTNIKNKNPIWINIFYIILAFSFLLASLLLYYKIKKQEKEFFNISRILSKIAEGDQQLCFPPLAEGAVSHVYNLLDSLNQAILVKNSRLKLEKEETKALVTDISHQLKTPLSSLKTCFSLLTEEELDSSEKEEFTIRTWEQIQKLENLITALVNISRMEHGMILIKPEQKNIQETLLRAINGVIVKSDKKKITLITEDLIPYILPHDEKWTEEAIGNVLDNAIKYSPNDSQIIIRMLILQFYVRIEIQDSGIGINKTEYNNIFKRFYRGKSEIVKNQEGSGVGLYLTRKILESQGGTIAATSKNNQGTTFIIQLPLK